MPDESYDFLLSIVIPVYNEEPGIPVLLDRLQAFIEHGKSSAIGTEIIFIDDHSSDNSFRILKEIAQKNNHYRVFRLSRNCGSHVAIIAGLSEARGNCSVFLAADLQDPPELIFKMVEKWKKGKKVVWAVREKREGIPMSERVFARLFYFIFNKMSDIKLPKTGADFALMDKEVVSSLLKSVGAKPSLGALINWLGYDQAEILYTKEKRKFGKSKWTYKKKINGFLDSIIAFSYVPMRAMMSVGFVTALLGLLYAIVIVTLNICGKPVVGWSSLMIVVLLLGGVQMVMVGVLGEYLWRNLEESRKRPLYFIEDLSDKT